MLYLMVFVGAGIGGALRHGVNVWAARAFGYGFPFGTLIVNVFGSFVMGLFVGFFAFQAGLVPQHARLFLTTGVLGGFTTFSAFSLDAALLFERHSYSMAAAYMAGSVFEPRSSVPRPRIVQRGEAIAVNCHPFATFSSRTLLSTPCERASSKSWPYLSVERALRWPAI